MEPEPRSSRKIDGSASGRVQGQGVDCGSLPGDPGRRYRITRARVLPTADESTTKDNSQGLQSGGAYPFVFSHCPVSGFWSISQDAMLNPPLALAWLMTLPLTLISHCTDPLPWSCALIA